MPDSRSAPRSIESTRIEIVASFSRSGAASEQIPPRRGFSARVLVNYAGDRISDVGANQAPDIIEQGRETVDVVLTQRLGSRFSFRLSGENLTDAEYLFTQGTATQRTFKFGRTLGVSFGLNVF